jgi:hypothetical protein
MARWPPVEQPELPSPPGASGAGEEAPRPAVRKPAMSDADHKLKLSEADYGRNSVQRDLAASSHRRNPNDRQFITKGPSHTHLWLYNQLQVNCRRRILVI